MLVDTFLTASAGLFPEKIGLVSGPRRLTYRELAEGAAALACGIAALGGRRGDRVVIHLENGPEAALAIFGVLKAGCIIVPVNPTVKREKLAYILNDCAASVLITDQPETMSALGSAPSVLSLVVVGDDCAAARSTDDRHQAVLFESLLARYRGAACIGEGIDLDLAAILYTSGSTGRPKGVMLTHANIVTAATSIADYLRMSSEDIVLNVLPFSFDYGLYQLFLTWKTAGCLVLEKAFAYPSMVLDLIVHERVTGLPIVPMMAALLLRQHLSAYDLSSIRFISNTGAVLPPSHIAALRERLPGVQIFKMYGLTECKRVSFLPPEEIDNRPTSVGKPMDNVEVYLIDEKGERLDCGVGELVIRGANVMQGYWGAPDDTEKVLRPGPIPGERVLHSGDMFRIDEEGFMYFLNRIDDVIKSRGQKVSPREVEQVLQALPGVLEAFVLGVPDAVVGDAIKAYVTLDGSHSITEQDILRHCSRNLEDFMVPKVIEIVAALPRTTSGKIARHVLESNTGQ